VVVSGDLTPAAARVHAFGEHPGRARESALLRVVLQIVYFPFWMVRVSGGGAARVGWWPRSPGGLVREDVALGDVEALAAGPTRGGPTLGLRPLICPNCGWSLPLRPDDLVFHCSSCERAWLARGEHLDPIRFSVVAAAGPGARCHLPVWRFAVPSAAAIFAPAFRCRRPRALLDLGMRLTRRQVTIERAQNVRSDLIGCALDAEDARGFADFVAAGLAGEEARGAGCAVLPSSVDSLPADLLWMPFVSDGYALRELATGTPVPLRLLDIPRVSSAEGRRRAHPQPGSDSR